MCSPAPPPLKNEEDAQCYVKNEEDAECYVKNEEDAQCYVKNEEDAQCYVCLECIHDDNFYSCSSCKSGLHAGCMKSCKTIGRFKGCGVCRDGWPVESVEATVKRQRRARCSRIVA